MRPDASWAKLMKYSFALDVLECPRCGDRLWFVEVVLDRKRVPLTDANDARPATHRSVPNEPRSREERSAPAT